MQPITEVTLGQSIMYLSLALYWSEVSQFHQSVSPEPGACLFFCILHLPRLWQCFPNDKPFVRAGQSCVQASQVQSYSLVCCSLIFTLQQRFLVRFKFCAIKMGTPPHSSHFLFRKCVDSVSEWVLWPAGSAGSFYFCWRTHSWYSFPHVCLWRAKLFPTGFELIFLCLSWSSFYTALIHFHFLKIKYAF